MSPLGGGVLPGFSSLSCQWLSRILLISAGLLYIMANCHGQIFFSKSWSAGKKRSEIPGDSGDLALGKTLNVEALRAEEPESWRYQNAKILAFLQRSRASDTEAVDNIRRKMMMLVQEFTPTDENERGISNAIPLGEEII